MGMLADSWLKEARAQINSCQNLATHHPDPADMKKLANAALTAVKAVVMESHGEIPQQYHDPKLVTLCQKTGVWDVLPPVLKNFVQEIEPYGGANGGAASAPTVTSGALQKCFSVAPRFVDYIEQHVIGNDSVLSRLTVV
jgi:hypothetical protein